MSTTTATLPDPAAAGGAPRRWPLVALLLAFAAALGWSGGATGALGVAMAALAGWRVAGAARTGIAATARTPVTAVSGRLGAGVMVAQVVPVWSRQLEVTRDAASEGLSQVLQTFSEVAGALATLAQRLDGYSVSAAPGALDEAVRQAAPALAILTSASARAHAQRDAAVAELARCGEGLAELQQLARQARELARHTRLVAFNASIEAKNQRGSAEGGTQAVASELRMLSGRIGDTGEKIERVVRTLSGPVDKARRAGAIADTAPDELALEIELRAREALTALMTAIGGSLQSSSELQQLGLTLNEQVEAAFIHFQFGDRISQMLSIVAGDMSNFARWVVDHPQATQTDAAEWLTALEASYTMDEQRSSHHGNVHVEHSPGVEFF